MVFDKFSKTYRSSEYEQHNATESLMSRKLFTAKGTSKQQSIERKRHTLHKIYLIFQKM
jgi:hypothetical protein